MLCLRHDFYNKILKIKQIMYSLRVSPPPLKRHILGAHLQTAATAPPPNPHLQCRLRNKFV
jgi:hypothetical protein